MAQWAKRPPLKLEVPVSKPRGWFNGRAGIRDPFRWLETARGLSPIRLIGRASPGDWPFPRYKGCPNASFRCLSEEITSFFYRIITTMKEMKLIHRKEKAKLRFINHRIVLHKSHITSTTYLIMCNTLG